MATGTFAAGLKTQARVRHAGLTVESVVALQAKLAALAAHQQHAVSAAVRIVAGGAAFHLRGRMLVQIRPALLRMALDASFKVRSVEARHVKARGIHGAVRVVAIGTLHQLLRHTMMNGERKLGFDRSVARKAQSGFGLLQQAVVQPSNLIRQGRDLKEIGLRVGQVFFALIFDLLHQMSGVALIA